jgi:hypothetical protein
MRLAGKLRPKSEEGDDFHNRYVYIIPACRMVRSRLVPKIERVNAILTRRCWVLNCGNLSFVSFNYATNVAATRAWDALKLTIGWLKSWYRFQP